MAATEREDPIRDRYYKPVERAERASTFFFYVGAVLSFAAILVDRTKHPAIFDAVQVGFVLVAFAWFVIGHVIRIFLFPDALDGRRRDLLSNAFGVKLAHEETVNYYNNDETDPVRRLGVNTLENSMFTRALANAVLWPERLKAGMYIAAFLIVAMYHGADLTLVGVAAQVVFSEEVVSRWARLEFLRSRSHQTYEGLSNLLQAQNKPTRALLHVRVVEWFGIYESAKANAGLLLPKKKFDELNPKLKEEWERIKKSLGL